MIHLLYSAVLYLGLIVLCPVILWTLAANPKQRAGFWQKLGFFLPRQTKRTIWIHAVSVGETLAVVQLVKELCESSSAHRILFSTTTPTGQEVARSKLSPLATVFYFPYDFPGAARRAVKAINPAVLVLVDTEIWPNVIRACKKRGGKVAMVNGRVSDRSFPRYRRFYWLVRYALKDFSLLMMQSGRDGERIIEMGAAPEKVDAIGNLKFDQPTKSLSREETESLRRSIGLGAHDPVVFLGSVHKGEEAAIRAAVETRRAHPDVRIVIAPRRIDDLWWIEQALHGSGLKPVRKTSMKNAPSPGDKRIVPVIDTFGELARLYAVADVAFAGGSLIRHGGQNPLEPAAHGAPVLFGPDMSNFPDVSQALLDAGGAWTVTSQEDMARRLTALLEDKEALAAAGEAARAVVERNSGATKKAAEYILALAHD